MKYAETLPGDSHGNTTDWTGSACLETKTAAETAMAAKPWLATIALVCAVISVLAIMDNAIPMLFMTISVITLSILGMLAGGISIRQQLFEKTASMAVFVSVISLIALAGSHLQ